MKAIFRETEGAYLQATVVVDGLELKAMDEFNGESYLPGQEVDITISVGMHYEDESWESMFSGNPHGKTELQHQSGWTYRALGIVVSIKPDVMVDIGFAELEAPISTSDINVVGASVAFTINRLDAHAS